MFSKRLQELDSYVAELRGQKKLYIKQIRQAKITKKKSKQIVKSSEVAVQVLKEYLGIVTVEVIALFEKTITAGLQEIFDPSYQFSVVVASHKNKNIAEFMIKTSEYNDPIEISMSQGTMLKQVVSVMCRIVIVCLDKNLAKVLFLDEAFSGSEKERLPSVAEFLKKTIDDFGIQVVLITHESIFEEYADKVINL